MTPGEQAEGGREGIRSGRLLSLKEQFNLSWPVLASLIGCDATALRQWVAGTREPNDEYAQRLGAWLLEIEDTIEDITLKHDPEELVPLSIASQYLGMSYTTVLQKCQERALTCVDLGGLGIYIHKRDLPMLRESA